MGINKKGAVVGGKERIRGWLRSCQTSRVATGCDRPFRELNLHILEVRLAVRVCVQAHVFYVYLHLMDNFTIRETCVDAAIVDDKIRRPQRLHSKLGCYVFVVFPSPADGSGTLLLQFDQQSVGTGGPDIVRGMVNRVQVNGLTGFDCY